MMSFYEATLASLLPPPALATTKTPTATVAMPDEACTIINVNTATAAQIQDKLPGIGQKTASKIVAGRPYANAAALAKVMTPTQFRVIAPLVTFN